MEINGECPLLPIKEKDRMLVHTCLFLMKKWDFGSLFIRPEEESWGEWD